MILEIVKIKTVKNKTAVWVKTMRKNQNFSQDQLATILNVSRITIQNLESGKNITFDTLLKVLQYFDSLDKLYDFIDSEISNNQHKSLY